MREVVELVDVVAAAVQQDADAAVGRLADAGAHALSPALVAGRFRLVGVGIQAAAIVVVVAAEVIDESEAQRAAEALGPHGGVVVVLPAAADQQSQAAQGVPLHPAEAAVDVVAAVVE